MTKLRTKFFGLMIGAAVAGFGTTALQGCDGGEGPGIPSADDICGPCGSIATGQLTIAGNAQLDGFFNAVGTFQGATAKIKSDFDADILALAEVWGYGEANATVDAAFVQGLVAHIKGEFTTNLEGGIRVNYVPARCEANVDVAVSAQASCEAQADCQVEANPGQVSVACEGTCSGSCDASCSGSLSCAVKTPTVACEGECEGSCQLDVEGECGGTCRGTCNGECAVRDANGECAGQCNGGCTGTCELKARASCGGTCHGTCFVEQGSAQCTAEAECSGKCEGQCGGSCEGSFTPPSASADCSASAECNAQASAQASASLECTPPQLAIEYDFKAGLAGDAKASFQAKLAALQVRGVAILQGAAKLGALIDGKVNGEVVFNPSPLAQIAGEVNGIANASLSGDLDIPTGRIPCVIPAFKEAANILGAAGTEFAGTIQAQAAFAGVFNLN